MKVLERALLILIVILIGCSNSDPYDPMDQLCYKEIDCPYYEECRFDYITQSQGVCVPKIPCETNRECLDDRHCNGGDGNDGEQFCGYSSVPFQFIDTPLPIGYSNYPYYTKLEIRGNSRSYSFRLDHGTLPEGVIFSNNGTIVGIPLEQGIFELTLTAINGPDDPYAYYYNIPAITKTFQLEIKSGNPCDQIDCSDTPNSYCDRGHCECYNGFHPENGLCISDYREEFCSNQLPENGYWGTENPEGIISQEWDIVSEQFLPEPNHCNWFCNTGYFKDGDGFCVDQDPCLEISCHELNQQCEGGVCICKEGYHLESEMCIFNIRNIQCTTQLPQHAYWETPFVNGMINQQWYPSVDQYLPNNNRCTWQCEPGFISTGEQCVFNQCPNYMEQSEDGCNCFPGYQGRQCDQCSDNALLIEGICQPQCPFNQIWQDGHCQCPLGTSNPGGETCTDPCLLKKCGINKICTLNDSGKAICICDQERGYSTSNQTCIETEICLSDILEEKNQKIIPLHSGTYQNLTLLKKDCTTGVDHYRIDLFTGERLKVTLTGTHSDFNIRLLNDQSELLIETSSNDLLKQINIPIPKTDEIEAKSYYIDIFNHNPFDRDNRTYSLKISRLQLNKARTLDPGAELNLSEEISLDESISGELTKRSISNTSCGFSNGKTGYYHFTLMDPKHIMITLAGNQYTGFTLFKDDDIEIGCHHLNHSENRQGSYRLDPGRYIVAVHQLMPLKESIKLKYTLTLNSLDHLQLPLCAMNQTYHRDFYGNFQCECDSDRGYFSLNNHCVLLTTSCPDGSRSLVKGITERYCNCLYPTQPAMTPWGNYRDPFYQYPFDSCLVPKDLQGGDDCDKSTPLLDPAIYQTYFTSDGIDHEETCNLSGGQEQFYHFSISDTYLLHLSAWDLENSGITLALEDSESCSERSLRSCQQGGDELQVLNPILLSPGNYQLIFDQGLTEIKQLLFYFFLGKACTAHHCDPIREQCVPWGPNILNYHCICNSDAGYISGESGCQSPCDTINCNPSEICQLDADNRPFCGCPDGTLLFNQICTPFDNEGIDQCGTEEIEIKESGVWSGSTEHNNHNFSLTCSSGDNNHDLHYTIVIEQEQDIEISLQGDTSFVYALRKTCDRSDTTLFCEQNQETQETVEKLSPGRYTLIIQSVSEPGTYHLFINFLK